MGTRSKGDYWWLLDVRVTRAKTGATLREPFGPPPRVLTIRPRRVRHNKHRRGAKRPRRGAKRGCAVQVVGQKNLRRTLHVWTKLSPRGPYKCVLCGGISKAPADACEPERYERLTGAERALCPPKG